MINFWILLLVVMVICSRFYITLTHNDVISKTKYHELAVKIHIASWVALAITIYSKLLTL